MNLAKPHSALCTGIDPEILVELARSTRGRSGRELARRIGRSWGGVGPALDRLAVEGIIELEPVGTSHVFTLNRRHLVAPLIESLANLRTAFFDLVRDLIAEWDIPPIHASIFGSMARGDGNRESDIDFFLVRPGAIDFEDAVWRRQLDDLADRVHGWTGNSASLIEVGPGELDELRRRGRPILNEINSDAVVVAGTTVREVLGD